MSGTECGQLCGIYTRVGYIARDNEYWPYFKLADQSKVVKMAYRTKIPILKIEIFKLIGFSRNAQSSEICMQCFQILDCRKIL